MANIEISNLYSVGSELFKDSESFMAELVDSELGSINGGIIIPLLPHSTFYLQKLRDKPTPTFNVFTLPRITPPKI